MRITTKGQVTIPQEIRERVGLMPGCEVTFHLEDNRVYLEKLNTPGRGEAIVKRMEGKGSIRMTTDEILALTRQDR